MQSVTAVDAKEIEKDPTSAAYYISTFPEVNVWCH